MWILLNSSNGIKYIGLCLTQINNHLQHEFFQAVAAQAYKYGYKLLVFNSFADFWNDDGYTKGEERVFDLIPYHELDGLIVMSETIKRESLLNKIIDRAKAMNVYTVSVDKHIDGCYNIEYDYRGAFEKIVRHVVEQHSCKKISIMAGFKDNPFSDERIDCCRKTLSEYGLTLDDDLIMYGDFWADPTARAMDEFFASGKPIPDAIICCNDSMAITVCQKLSEYGYSVPDRVIVTGFDGIFEEQYHLPRLTTARQNVELAGQKAVDAIVEHLNGTCTSDKCIIEHNVIYSHSCGCKPIDYREATGQITLLFKLADDDNSIDTYMAEFSAEMASVSGIDQAAKSICRYNLCYGYYYYALALIDDFMNMTDNIESYTENRELPYSKRRLIVCESNDSTHYDPYFSDHPLHLIEALNKYNVFMCWSIHFQGKYMGHGIMGLSTGCDGFYSNDDIRHLLKYTRNLNNVLEIANSQAALKKVIAKLQDLYIRDHTGLYNRRGFYSEINRYIFSALENKDTTYHLIIISLDMDGLKFINDTYGHSEGDAAIKAIASALISVWGEHEICSRFGGDEFTVACVTTDNPDEKSRELVGKIQSHIDTFNGTQGKPYRVGGSFGVHYEPVTEGIVVDALIKAADDKMYKEKATHKESRYRSSARQ